MVSKSIVSEELKHGDDADIMTWLASVRDGRSNDEMAVIEAACRLAHRAHAGQSRASGEPYILHALAVAGILAQLNLDHETIAAALLHDVVEDTDVTLDELRQQFGETIANLVNGVTKMRLIQAYKHAGDSNRKEQVQAENLRKMLLAMAEDVRVVLIKLADRLHNLRTLGALPEHKQQRIARETLEIYAPLANRLGIWQIKWELEDLSFRFLDPDNYKKIARMVDQRRSEREQYLQGFVQRLQAELTGADIRAVITARPKHIYSIWCKIQRKAIDFDQLYDVLGVRVLVDTIKDCYAALGVVHSLWQYIPGEFDDYIATPKENNYRSIHTAVIGPAGRIVEVQVRTHEMHQHNELGIAAHWAYKEGRGRQQEFMEKINWLRQLIEWKNEVSDAGDFVEQFKADLFQDRIYVFTPKGQIIDLPQGATPLDFAYHIHTEIGHRCRGAKVNGHMVPLTYTLETGQQVEIQTVKQGGPSRDWVNPHLGYLQTSRARAKAQHWFHQQDFDKNVAEGHALFDKELKRIGLPTINIDKLAERLGYRRTDEFFAAIANGDLKGPRYLSMIQQMLEPARDDKLDLPVPGGDRPLAPRKLGRSGIVIEGVGNLMTSIANCCKPIAGDPIIGFITQGRGVSIHRGDCPNVLYYRRVYPERMIPVSWGEAAKGPMLVDIEVLSTDRQGLLRDIGAVFANDKISLLAVNTRSDTRENIARMRFTLEINDLDTLNKVLTKVEQIPDVREVRRLMN
ncbi:MAG: GTP diphosphokinase [Gammaproteobacteria bacterium]|nr:GTP diphosphokinase [Gammaproteobacteria bacterium]